MDRVDDFQQGAGPRVDPGMAIPLDLDLAGIARRLAALDQLPAEVGQADLGDRVVLAQHGEAAFRVQGHRAQAAGDQPGRVDEQLAVISALDIEHLAAFDARGVVLSIDAPCEEIEINAEGFFANLGKHRGRDELLADPLLLDDDGRVVAHVLLDLVQRLTGNGQGLLQRGGLACGVVPALPFRRSSGTTAATSQARSSRLRPTGPGR